MNDAIATRVVPSVEPARLSSAQVRREFRRLLEGGATLLVQGASRAEPESLLADGYTPKHALELFGHRFYLANVRQNPLLRFFVAYVLPPRSGTGPRKIHARIFYKDVSLLWRAGSHLVANEHELWIGKGDTRITQDGDRDLIHTVESTTDLPFEMQAALDRIMRRAKRIRRDTEALVRVLRNAPDGRIEPYADFTQPRRAALGRPNGTINGGRRIAWFRRQGVPESLVFARGFEPDFADGLLEIGRSRSKSYGGALELHRILSRNRRVQYLFFAAPRHVWLAPPQALTVELSSYGLRTVDVRVDDDLCIPGYEYHYLDDPVHEDSLHSQIPEGFAGAPNAVDPDRADASAWLDRLPVVKAFRREVLARGRRRSRAEARAAAP